MRAFRLTLGWGMILLPVLVVLYLVGLPLLFWIMLGIVALLACFIGGLCLVSKS